MFQASEYNKLYDFHSETQMEVVLKRGEEPVDIMAFLNDVSLWMEAHHNVIMSKYLPFSCIAVGLTPTHASAFMYGCFVGRAMEKEKLKVETTKEPIDKKEIAKKIKESVSKQMGWFKSILKQINDIEKEGDKNDKI